MFDKAKNMLIGLFVVAACTLVISLILFLEPTVGDGKQTLVVRFANINGIGVGTRVLFAGKPVGEVVQIEEIPHAREQPTNELGQVFFYQLILHVDSSVRLYNTDEVTVQTSGLLGEKSIGLFPKTPPKGVKPVRITDKTPVYAESVDPLEMAFTELTDLSDKIEETLSKVNVWIDENGNALGCAIRSFGAAMSEIAVTVQRINYLRVVDSVKIAIDNFSDTTCQISSVISELEQNNVFSNFSIMMANLKDTSFSLDTIAKDIADGKGTIGKLIKYDDFYLRMTAFMTKANTLMNDVNQYGIFFYMNKQWQRMRLKRVAALNCLETPEQFQNYFEGEVGTVVGAMERLSMLIDRASQYPQSEKIMDTPAFKEDFAEMMRQVQALSDMLKLYNEKLMELNPSCHTQ